MTPPSTAVCLARSILRAWMEQNDSQLERELDRVLDRPLPRPVSAEDGERRELLESIALEIRSSRRTAEHDTGRLRACLFLLRHLSSAN